MKNQEVLIDKKKNGEEQPWRPHKMNNTLLSMAYETISKSKSERLKDCSSWLTFNVKSNGEKKLKRANFCRVRLCPICTWRRSLKVYIQTMKIIEAIANSNNKMTYIMATFTMKNVNGEGLDEAITNILQSFKKLVDYAEIKKATKGWYRGLEITHNIENDTYHPHIHVLFAVKQSYFKDTRVYLSQKKWTENWKKALKVDYTPIVNVKKCYGKDAKAVAEVAKYTCKTSDYIMANDWDLTIKTVELLDKALNKRRFVAYGGIMKEWHKKLNLDDVEKGDLINLNEEETEKEQNTDVISYIWQSGYNQYYKQN